MQRSLVAPTLFGELPEEMRSALLANAPARIFGHDQIIQQRGDEPSGFWVIEEGLVKIGQFRIDGEFRGLALLSSGDSYGELAMFSGSKRAVDSVAEGDVKLRWIGAREFEAAIESDPQVLRKLVSALAVELQEVLGLVAGLGKGTSGSRIAAILANLAGDESLKSTIKLGQQELAELTGLTRVTVNKCLSELEAIGALKRHYGKIEICDLEMLKAKAIG